MYVVILVHEMTWMKFVSQLVGPNLIVIQVSRTRQVVDNFIILLVLKFDNHKSDRLEVMLFTNSVTEFVQFLYIF
jgi:hypothetical protein